MSEGDEAKAKAIVDTVSRELQNDSEARQQGLHVTGSAWDIDWLHVMVVPSVDGVRAYEFAETLSRVEGIVRNKRGYPQILLVPASASGRWAG